MKKLCISILGLVLAFSLAACGCSRTETPAPSTTPSTAAPTVPVIPSTTPSMPEPTFDTNIPDPSVDTSMPDASGETGDAAARSQHTMH